MGSHHFTFTHLLKMIAHYWQWFILSVVICVCAAQLYVLRVTPAYRISGRLLISQADKYRRASYNLLKSVDNVSTVSNTTGYTPSQAVSQLNALSEEKKLPNTCFVLNGV